MRYLHFEDNRISRSMPLIPIIVPNQPTKYNQVKSSCVELVLFKLVKLKSSCVKLVMLKLVKLEL